MWIKRILAAAVGAALLSAAGCSSGPERKAPVLEQRLHTSITENGSKMFMFQMVRASGGDSSRAGGRPSGGRSGGPPGGGGGRGGDRGDKRGDKGAEESGKMLAEAHEALLVQLEQTGFCREGYMTLEESAKRGQLAIRGECNEAATEADRETFMQAPEPQFKDLLQPAPTQ
ncbi:hypothetical protein KO507_11085 [Gilvimarinus agarilyticus]|uniref:hypothetical protein n=1 Tax=Gilvimarinus sp. 2_MG-2023 TaxID=3062666 RepID=UPI001C09C11F|nr:hypothetical protein [Gilvimarinus sp. 2_MG-2023]MBU2886308.1 hypothetical protein [Gilvimarinus agarilyticus]MDO6570994.1 hypothetical protein [Gilvimarinus sp. 2_MG-2023]